MARPLRIEFAGALYHVTSRGDRKENIYETDSDRTDFLDVLGEVCDRYNWAVHGFCLMSNHYHLLVETPDGNLSAGMRQLNGVYTQKYNRSNQTVGHVFQGRFKGILVDKDSYLLELTRYIVLNPVRAQMVRTAKDWKWSSYRATVGSIKAPVWLDTEWILSSFGNRKNDAIKQYINYVAKGKDQPAPWDALKNQIFLGDEKFVERMLDKLDEKKVLSEIPKAQRKGKSLSLKQYALGASSRNQAIVDAYASGAFTLAEIGEYFGLHYSTVGGIVKHFKR